MLTSCVTPVIPSFRALVVRALPAADAGTGLAAVAAIETLASVTTPVWLGEIYAQAVDSGHAQLVFWALVGNAGLASAVLFCAAPRPWTEA